MSPFLWHFFIWVSPTLLSRQWVISRSCSGKSANYFSCYYFPGHLPFVTSFFCSSCYFPDEPMASWQKQNIHYHCCFQTNYRRLPAHHPCWLAWEYCALRINHQRKKLLLWKGAWCWLRKDTKLTKWISLDSLKHLWILLSAVAGRKSVALDFQRKITFSLSQKTLHHRNWRWSIAGPKVIPVKKIIQ